MHNLPIAGQYTFPREARLLRSGEYRRVLSHGSKYGGSWFVLYWLAATTVSRIGLTVSRKVGNAVTRNRVKRLAREYFRQTVQHWPNQREYVVIAKPAAGVRPNGELCVELERLFRFSQSSSSKGRSSRPEKRPSPDGSVSGQSE